MSFKIIEITIRFFTFSQTKIFAKSQMSKTFQFFCKKFFWVMLWICDLRDSCDGFKLLFAVNYEFCVKKVAFCEIFCIYPNFILNKIWIYTSEIIQLCVETDLLLDTAYKFSDAFHKKSSQSKWICNMVHDCCFSIGIIAIIMLI